MLHGILGKTVVSVMALSKLVEKDFPPIEHSL